MTLDLTEAQVNDLVALCDAAVRAQGLAAAKLAIPLLDHIQAAVNAEAAKAQGGAGDGA